ARLQYVQGTHHTLDCLVVSLIQRITGRAGHDGLESCFKGDLRIGPHERDRFKVTLYDFTEVDKGYPVVLIDDCIDSQAPSQHLHYLHLDSVQRVALHNTVCRPAILQYPRTMERAYRLLMCNAWSDNFSSSGIAGHEMRLHQPDDNAEISLNKAAVEPGFYAARGGSYVFMILVPTRKMVGYCHGAEDPVASDQLTKLIPFIRPMETCCNENSDRVGGHPSLDQLIY